MNWPAKKLGEIYNRLFSKNLKVSYISQINENACGAAVLEMVYKYYGLKNVSQEEIFNKYQELEPHGSGNLRITTDNLISDALSRGLHSFWARSNYGNRASVLDLLQRVISSRIPLIVCQKFTDEQPQMGHFRIVVGIRGNVIYVHDPHAGLGGAYKKWGVEKFLEFWQPTGDNVTGGVFVVIKKL